MMLRCLTLILLSAVFGPSAFAERSNHLITQRMAYRFNTRVEPKDYQKFATPVHLKYYLIPKAWVQITKDAVVAEDWKILEDPTHPEFVRIPVHPFDDEMPGRIETALKRYGFLNNSFVMETPFLLTESRSLYPVDPSRVPMSPRLSMTDGVGQWNGRTETVDRFGNTQSPDFDKLISSLDAQLANENSRKAQQGMGGVRGQYVELQPDRMIFTVQSPDGELSFGGTFRDVRSSARSDVILFPGFTGQHREGAQLLALANDKLTPQEYLIEVEAPVRGRAWAEFFALTGYQHSSPHSQNILIESDPFFRLTGAAAIRDGEDLIPDYDAQMQDPEMARIKATYQSHRQDFRIKLDGTAEIFDFRHNFRKGNYPSDISTADLTRAELIVAEAFISQLARMSGVPVEDIKKISESQVEKVEGNITVDTSYMRTRFKRDSATWKRIQSGLEKYRADLVAHRLVQPQPDFAGRQPLLHRHPQLLVRLRHSIVRSLKGLEPTASEQQFAQEIWQQKFQQNLSAKELEWAMTALVMTRILPLNLRTEALHYPMSLSAQKFAVESILESKDPEALIKTAQFIERNKLAKQSVYKDFLGRLFNQAVERGHDLETSMKLVEAHYFATMNSLEPSAGETLAGTQLREVVTYYRVKSTYRAFPASVRAHLRTLLTGDFASYMAEDMLSAGEYALPPRHDCDGQVRVNR